MTELFIFITGLIIGSFLNVVIYRLPLMLERKWREECLQFLSLNSQEVTQTKKINLFFPFSHCPYCKKTLHVINNIPLVSFILQKGQCRYCKHKISYRYPIVEFITACVSVLLFWQFGLNQTYIFAAIFTYALITLTFIDLDHQILPDEIILPLIWLGLISNLHSNFTTIDSAIGGAVVAYLALWSINFVFRFVTKKEGMGYGDFKLAAALGAWCGLSSLLFIFLFASFLGLLVGVALMILKKQTRDIPLPFGPFLSFAGFMVLTGSDFINRYLPWMVVG